MCSCAGDSAVQEPAPVGPIRPVVDEPEKKELKLSIHEDPDPTKSSILERKNEWAFNRKLNPSSFGKYKYVPKQTTFTPRKSEYVNSGLPSLLDKENYGNLRLFFNWFQEVPKVDSLPFAIPAGKQKQILLKGVLEQVFPRITFDKKITGASRSRPDYVIPGDTFTILVECDEFQHRHLTLFQEYQRMKDVLTDLRGLQTKSKCVFLRFNPDSYKMGYKTISAFFRKDLNGMLVAQDDFYLRVCKLIERVKWYLENPSACDGCDMVIEYLYYDTSFSNKVSTFLKMKNHQTPGE